MSGAQEVAGRLSAVEDRIKTEIAAHLWKTEPLFKERAKLRRILQEQEHAQ